MTVEAEENKEPQTPYLKRTDSTLLVLKSIQADIKILFTEISEIQDTLAQMNNGNSPSS